MLHKNAFLGDRHAIHNWSVASSVERLALVVAEEDIGKVCRQEDDDSFYILAAISPSVVWNSVVTSGELDNVLVAATSHTDTEIAALSTVYQPLSSKLTDVATVDMTGNTGLVLKVNATEDGYILGRGEGAVGREKLPASPL